MKSSRLFVQAVLILVAGCATQGFAQDFQRSQNTGIFEGATAPLSPALRFLASEAGKQRMLHSSNPGVLPLLKWFHPEAVGQYPQKPLFKQRPAGTVRPDVHRDTVVVTGCGNTSGTVMNLEPATNAVGQYGPMVDFLLSALGSGKDLVAEYGEDDRYYEGTFDSFSAMYVHRDPTVSCYGGTDFEMGNPPIADPFNQGYLLDGGLGARILADPGTTGRPAQFIVADMRFDDITSGIGLRRIPATSLESTTICPAGTLTSTQEATCAGSTGIIVEASEDNYADAPVLTQDPRSSGTGAGDIYVVSASVRELRTVILLTACKAAFATASDCSTPVLLEGSVDSGRPGVAVVGGGPNAGTIAISFVNEYGFAYVSCTPAGAPAPPVCSKSSSIYTDTNLYSTLTDNPGFSPQTWPVLAARTDSGGQTLFLVWSDCKLASYELSGCPQSQIVMATTTAVTNPTWTFAHISGASGHHFLPSVAFDSGQDIINVSYYSTGSNTYKNGVLMALNQFAPGSTTPESTIFLTGSYDSVQGDGTAYGAGFLGDYVGLAAHGGSASGSSRVYVGFTNNARIGIYSGIGNTQADNNVSRGTY
jgi:hypothetical protein